MRVGCFIAKTILGYSWEMSASVRPLTTNTQFFGDDIATGGFIQEV